MLGAGIPNIVPIIGTDGASGGGGCDCDCGACPASIAECLHRRHHHGIGDTAEHRASHRERSCLRSWRREWQGEVATRIVATIAKVLVR